MATDCLRIPMSHSDITHLSGKERVELSEVTKGRKLFVNLKAFFIGVLSDRILSSRMSTVVLEMWNVDISGIFKFTILFLDGSNSLCVKGGSNWPIHSAEEYNSAPLAPNVYMKDGLLASHVNVKPPILSSSDVPFRHISHLRVEIFPKATWPPTIAP
ncbi:hypothetical protein Pfo_006559 [Paulownia fortunei]|nr:hypothetical protein Pfo_006559 [Paulownia fortunei]